MSREASSKDGHRPPRYAFGLRRLCVRKDCRESRCRLAVAWAPARVLGGQVRIHRDIDEIGRARRVIIPYPAITRFSTKTSHLWSKDRPAARPNSEGQSASTIATLRKPALVQTTFRRFSRRGIAPIREFLSHYVIHHRLHR